MYKVAGNIVLGNCVVIYQVTAYFTNAMFKSSIQTFSTYNIFLKLTDTTLITLIITSSVLVMTDHVTDW